MVTSTTQAEETTTEKETESEATTTEAKPEDTEEETTVAEVTTTAAALASGTTKGDTEGDETDKDPDAEPDGEADEDGEGTKEDDVRVVRIGVVGEANAPWEAAKENLEGTNIEIELVKFSDYILPNAALAEGEIELNSFQHRMFLENEIETQGYEIEEIGASILAPLTMYSEKYESVEEIPEGGIIAIPNDPTNGGRALKLLESAGLIKMDPEVGYLGTESDITENPLNLEILAVEASMTAQNLPDVAASVIKGHHASTHGLVPEDGIYTENVGDDPDSPFINVIVARSDEADDPDYLKIVEAFQQDNVAQVILDEYKGTQLPAWPDALKDLDLDEDEDETEDKEDTDVTEDVNDNEGQGDAADVDGKDDADQADQADDAEAPAVDDEEKADKAQDTADDSNDADAEDKKDD